MYIYTGSYRVTVLCKQSTKKAGLKAIFIKSSNRINASKAIEFIDNIRITFEIVIMGFNIQAVFGIKVKIMTQIQASKKLSICFKF